MQIKHGLRSDLRSAGRAVLTLFLFFLVTALLGSSLGTVWSVQDTLRSLSDSYVTVATAVLDTGTETPDASALKQSAEALDALPLPDGALRWSPNRYAQAWLSEAPEIIETRSVSDYGVVLVDVKEPGALSTRNTLPASAKEQLFSVKKALGKNLEIYAENLVPGKRYLVYGRWYVGSMGIDYCLEALEPPLEIPDPENWRETPGAQEYLDLAERLTVRQRSVQAYFPEDPAVSFPFQQNAVQVTRGRSFTPEELAGGARVCLIPEKLAKYEKLELGDRLPISLAVGNDPERSDCYEPARGFDLEAEYEIVGLLYTKDDWKYTIFLPPQRELDLRLAKTDSLLGQYLLDNDRTEDFLRAAENSLPAGVQINVYDQGYAEAAEPLRLMLRTVRLIAGICLAAGLCFLILNLWLFVSRQKQAGALMHRLGAPRAAVPVYFLSAMIPLALPALAGGVWFSRWAAGIVARRLSEALARDPGAATRFSDAKLSLRQTVELMEAPVPLSVYLAVAGGLLILSCLLCWFLSERTAPRTKPRSRIHSLRTRTRTQALRGGVSKYALLSAKRGGFRTAVTLLAPVAAVLLLCGLNQTRQNTELRLRDIEENTEIRGYFTDLYGAKTMRGSINEGDVISVAELPQATHLTATESNGYHVRIISALRMEERSAEPGTDESGEEASTASEDPSAAADSTPDPGGEEATETRDDDAASVGISANDSPYDSPTDWKGPHYTAFGPMTIPEVPYSKFQESRLEWQSSRRDPELVFTDSMLDVPQIMFRGGQTIRWLEGCSDADMQWRPEPEAARGPSDYHKEIFPQESWDAEQQNLRDVIDFALREDLLPKPMDCVVSDALLNKWGLDLGGCFLVANTGNWGTRTGMLRLITYRIIGVYHSDNPRDPIFHRASFPLGVGEEGTALRAEFAERENRQGYYHVAKLKSAVFRFKASDLEGLKESLAEIGLTEVGDRSGIRKPFLLEDQVFLSTKRSVEQRLWYMERIFPVVSGLTLLLALVLSVLQLLARRREIWLMHCTGTGRARAFGSLFTEQAGLCLLGLGAGLGLCVYWRLLNPEGLRLSLIFGGLWLTGAAVMGLYLTKHPRRIGREE